MRLPAEKLRWFLLGGGLLLAFALAAIFGLANYRAGKIWQRILARNGVNLRQETDGYTYSQSDGKRTLFTLHAAKAMPHGNGKWSLNNAVLVLYGKDGRTDRIYGSQFDYDQEAGVARAIGEVHMDLQAPAAAGKGGRPGAEQDLSFTPGDGAAADPGLIHVRTSGVVYTRKLGVAATQEPAEFRYGSMLCRSRGAEFDSGPNILRLLNDVRLDGTLHDAPFTLSAAHADLDRTADTANLFQPVWLAGEQNARADHAVLHLRSGGSLDTGEADGAVALRSGTREVRSPQARARFNAENRPEHALLSGGVQFNDVDPGRPAQGAARSLDLGMSSDGVLRTATAEGGVHLLAKTAGGPGQAASRQLRGERAVASFDPGGSGGKHALLRTLHVAGSAEMVADMPGRAPREEGEFTHVAADDLLTEFSGSDHDPQPQNMTGKGHTQLEQRGSEGRHQVSTGDTLRMSFAERLGGVQKDGDGVLEVVSATQAGHVVLRFWGASKTLASTASGGTSLSAVQGGTRRENPGDGAGQDGPAVGHAAQAVYEAAAGTLTLTGDREARADVYDGATQLAAPSIVLHEGTGDGEASGGVLATTGGENGAPATHVLAAHAALLHQAGISEFFGTDGQPARLWQAGSQVEAARLLLDGQHHTLSARPEKEGRVHAIFASAGSGSSTTKPTSAGKVRPAAGSNHGGPPLLENMALPEASRDTVDVRAAAMDYNDVAREATFAGDVHLRGAEGEITGKRGAAFLAPAEERRPQTSVASAGIDSSKTAGSGIAGAGEAGFGGRLQRFVVLGDVHLAQPNRTGLGEQLTYTAATDTFVLTGSGGNLPRVHDARQGLVTGTTLVFGTVDSSIVVGGTGTGKQVAGQTPDPHAKPLRIHTETDLKQQ